MNNTLVPDSFYSQYIDPSYTEQYILVFFIILLTSYFMAKKFLIYLIIPVLMLNIVGLKKSDQQILTIINCLYLISIILGGFHFLMKNK